MVVGLLTLAFAAPTAGADAQRRSSSTRITAAVKKELSARNIPGAIEVTADDGVVTLSGSVPDARAKARAEELASHVGGVEHVVNNLRTTMAADAPPAIVPPNGIKPKNPAAPSVAEWVGGGGGLEPAPYTSQLNGAVSHHVLGH